MSSLSLQRDLQTKRRHELNRNINLLNIWHPVHNDLRLLLKDDMFDKPNQAAFIHLSYYLVNIIDCKKAASLSSVLYDKKSENIYRGQLVAFIASVNDEGLITPVMSSHLVNAGGYKVTKLMFQLSQLAMKRAIQQRFTPDDSKLHFLDLNKSVKRGDKNQEDIKNEMDSVLERVETKTLDWYQYQNKVIEVSELYKMAIKKLEIENKRKKCLLREIIKSFLQYSSCKDMEYTQNIETLGDVFQTSPFITNWNDNLQSRLEYSERKWSQNAEPLLKKGSLGRILSESLVTRHTIKDHSSYTLEFEPETDNIDLNCLEKHVSSQQRYVLKNVVQDGVLQMPYLLRAYAALVCFAFCNGSAMHSIVQFDNILSTNRGNYSKKKTKMRNLLSEVLTFDQQVTISASTSTLSISPVCDVQELHRTDSFPQLPVIRFTERSRLHFVEQSKLTPLHISRLQFNVKRQDTQHLRPCNTVFDVAPRGALKQSTFLKHIENVRLDLAELKMGPPSLKADVMQRSMQHDISRSNQTLTDRSNMFSKQQIARLFTASSRKLSGKKSSSRIYEQSVIEDHRNRKWNKLFNETIETEAALYKSHSSPNLNEMHSMRKSKIRVQRDFKHSNLCESLAEDNPESPAHASGIRLFNAKKNSSNMPGEREKYTTLMKPVNHTPTSKGYTHAKNYMYSLQHFGNKNSLQQYESPSGKGNNVMDQNNDMSTPSCKWSLSNSNNRNITKTKSIERIIERYKKIQNTSVLHVQRKIDMFTTEDFPSPILPKVDEKETESNVDVSPNNRLPDLLSPSFQIYSQKGEVPGIKKNISLNVKKRESLGTALGVDNTFLDQFDLID